MAPIQLLTGWRHFQGHIHGLQQGSIAGNIRILPSYPIDPEILDAVMATPLQGPAAIVSDTGTPAFRVAHRLAFWSGQIQRLARIPVSQRYIVIALPPDNDPGEKLCLVLPAAAPEPAMRSLTEMAKIIGALIDPASKSNAGLEVTRQIDELLAALRSSAPASFNLPHLLAAAFDLDYPVSASPGIGIRIGTGCHSRLMDSTITEQTPAIGMKIARDKVQTATVLRAAGLPAASHEPVHSVDEAIAAANRLGYPVVIKPADLDGGQGVAAGLRSAGTVTKAFVEARKLSSRVLVEKHFEGFGHRLTVFRGKVLSALKRIPGGALGDGVHSVKQLLELQLNDPEVRRNLNKGRVPLDEQALEMLAERGLSQDYVPAAGEFITLRRRDNISAGGRSEALELSVIHPANIQLAIRAANAVCLDLAGVDLLIPDITVSWLESGALVCEVNGSPQFGPGRDGRNYHRVIESLAGPAPRIPVHLYIDGSIEPSKADRRLDAIRRHLQMQTATSRRGLMRDEGIISAEFPDARSAGLCALGDRTTTSVLISAPAAEIIVHGLPIDRVDSVIVDPQDSLPADAKALVREAIFRCGSPESRVPLRLIQ